MNCNFSVLKRAIESVEECDPELEAVAEHVESCAECRVKLTELGGDGTSWMEAAQWLTMDAAEEPADGEPADGPNLPMADLSFLEPPTSPEMLGNIGRYEVESFLGQGGMGIVLRAHDSDLQRTVAVKVLAPQWAASPVARRRFAREAQAAASVAHENVIPIYNVEASARLPYLVMRYIPGMTLGQWVHRNERMDVGTILRVAGQMAEGLAAAHRRGLIHRDIKPANVLVGENIERVWITDFGLARAADSVTLTQTGVIAGTPHYMSPEQARGESIDQRSDLFSFGCVLFFMCAKRPPFDAENTLAVLHRIVNDRSPCVTLFRDDLPPSLAKLISQLLEPSVERRTKNCLEISERLDRAQEEHRLGKCQRRAAPVVRPVFWAAAACAGVIALCSVWSLGATNRGANSRSQRYAADQPRRPQPRTLRSLSHQLDPAIVAAARQITGSLNEASLAVAVEQLDRDLHEASRQGDWILANPLHPFDKNWHLDLKRLESEVAAARQAGVEFPVHGPAHPISNWKEDTNRIQASINRLKQSESWNMPPF